MKKTYSKPKIVFDSFELSQSIASCDAVTNAARNVCEYKVPDWNDISIFIDGVCDIIVPDGTEGVCYEIPAGTWNLFSS